MNKNTLLELKKITQSFTKPDGSKHIILDNINMRLNTGEIVAILGKSGSGKSTLLRIISGLIEATDGEMIINQKQSCNADGFNISIVFQTFALFPWLTVLENVELGLEALNIPEEEKRNRALDAINTIGLDGFESAMPRELSGGMKQRVGFARALVVRPEILLMDEPFSALDILTSNTLKHDFLDLWTGGKIDMKSVVLVTHSIEEAIMMADRALVLGSDPGRIVAELAITLPKPRDTQSIEFHAMVDQIYNLMVTASTKSDHAVHNKTIDVATAVENWHIQLPIASPNQLADIVRTIKAAPHNGVINLNVLVKAARIHTEEMLQIAEALSILQFASITGASIELNASGKLLAKSNSEQRKKIFGEHVLKHIPLAALILKTLQKLPKHRVQRSVIQKKLEKYLSHEEADTTLKIIITWGRYGELFTYDDNKKWISLDNLT